MDSQCFAAHFLSDLAGGVLKLTDRPADCLSLSLRVSRKARPANQLEAASQQGDESTDRQRRCTIQMPISAGGRDVRGMPFLAPWLQEKSGCESSTTYRRSRKKLRSNSADSPAAIPCSTLHLVVELGVIQHRENRAACARLGISGSKDQTIKTCVDHGSGTHGARLKRDVQCAAG